MMRGSDREAEERSKKSNLRKHSLFFFFFGDWIIAGFFVIWLLVQFFSGRGNDPAHRPNERDKPTGIDAPLVGIQDPGSDSEETTVRGMTISPETAIATAQRTTPENRRSPRPRETLLRTSPGRASSTSSDPDTLATARRLESIRSGRARQVLPSDMPEYWHGDTGIWKHLSYRVKQVHYVISHVMPDAPGVREGRRGRDTANPTGY